MRAARRRRRCLHLGRERARHRARSAPLLRPTRICRRKTSPTAERDLLAALPMVAPSSPGLRVVVLSCGDLGDEVARALLSVPGVSDVGLLTAPWPTTRRSFAARARGAYRANGPVGCAVILVRKFLPRPAPPETASRVQTPEDFARWVVRDFHDPDAIATLRAFAPDLGVVAGTYILREPVFDIPRLGCINLHSGKAPAYRGASPGFWELYNGETEVGITIHRVARALDAGDILLQETFALDPAPAVDPLAYLDRYRTEVLRPNGVRLLREAVARIAAGAATWTPQDHGAAATYRSPGYRAVSQLRRRVRARRRARFGTLAPLSRRAKIILGRLAFATGVYRAFFRRRAIIALFHRVDDALPDNPISCTRSAFETYCDFFRRHFRVVSLERLLEALARGEDVSRMLVITFDDGYADNREVAAVELARRGLPACFFIATEFIESARVPPWDQELGVRSRWMGWADVRALAEHGFEIGAHTMNHVDLGVVCGVAAEQEIAGSGRRLASQLGAAPPFFSYPFGRPDQITPANRDLVRAAGFACCLSAFGGSVRPGNDPFDLRRVPVSPWFQSPYQFGFETMLSRD